MHKPTCNEEGHLIAGVPPGGSLVEGGEEYRFTTVIKSCSGVTKYAAVIITFKLTLRTDYV